MGYDVFVTRAEHHFDGSQTPIPEGDWRAIIDNDPYLSAPDEAYQNYAVWASPGRKPGSWIDWANGNLFTRSPDDSFLRKLIELAGLLAAVVQGKDGERYGLEADHVVRIEPIKENPGPVVRESQAAEQRLSPPLEDILAAVDPPVFDETAPPSELPSEMLFGPKPRNAANELGVSTEGVEGHADASFASRPEEVLAIDSAGPPETDLPFRVGQRVRTDLGRPATVISIDPHAQLGAGQIELRFDDGRVVARDCLSHGLVPLDF